MEQPASNSTSQENLSTQAVQKPVEAELETQVAALETDIQQIDDSEVQAKVQQLIKLIRTTLKAQTLSAKTQKELARLLSLLSSLDNRHIQQLNLLELAVSLLLEPNDTPLASASAQGRLKSKNSEVKNLTFVQETRRQVAHQSRTYPDVIRAIVTGSGTPYIRLITGLTWFFFLFVLAPVALSGLVFAATRLSNFQKISNLEKLNAALVTDVQSKDTQIADLTFRNNALLVKLERTSRLLPKVSAIETPKTPSNNASLPPLPNTPPTDSLPLRVETLNSIQAEITQGLEDDAQQVAENTRTQPNPQLNRRANNSDSEGTSQTAGNPIAAEPPSPSARESGASVQLKDGQGQTLTFNVLPIRTGPWPIALAISIGALGGTVSVIVRANTFIRQAQESDNDLFLTGFFRPFVGMSFAIFCVALVEAGVFAGIFDLSNRDDADRTYFYIAIAFVAGFSERLVRDVVIKTEDTLAGPKITPQ